MKSRGVRLRDAGCLARIDATQQVLELSTLVGGEPGDYLSVEAWSARTCGAVRCDFRARRGPHPVRGKGRAHPLDRGSQTLLPLQPDQADARRDGREPSWPFSSISSSCASRRRSACASGARPGEDVKLAEVQFELARELGFQSWPKLKAYVERLALEQPFRTDLDYYEGRARRDRVGEAGQRRRRRDAISRRATGSRAGAQLRRHVEAMRSGEEPPTAIRACLPSGRGERSRAPRRAARPVPRPRRAARDERQRPARDGRRRGDRLAAARAWRRPEPRQRLRVDEAAPGRLRQRPRACQADARRRRAHRSVCPRRRRHAARRGAVLGPSRGRRAVGPGTRQPASRGRARRPRADPRT